MITLKQWMEIVNYRISEGSDYQWECYGDNAHRLDAWNGEQDGHSHSIVFDTKTQEVYEVTCYDYRNTRAYRFMNPDFVKKHKKEAKRRQVDYKEAWDECEYIDLEVAEDFVEKATAIENEEATYDTRIQVPLTLDDDQMFNLMKLAHQNDVTLNEYVEQLLRKVIDEHEIGEDLG